MGPEINKTDNIKRTHESHLFATSTRSTYYNPTSFYELHSLPSNPLRT